jgi:hypothetical protein
MPALLEGCSSRAPFFTCNAAFNVGIERSGSKVDDALEIAEQTKV